MPHAPGAEGTCLATKIMPVLRLQEFFHYRPPGARGESGQTGRTGGLKRALPEAECLTPASKRARLTYLANTKDVNKGLPPPDGMVSHALAKCLESIILRCHQGRALPEAECLTPAFKRARLTDLVTIKDVNKGMPPHESMLGSAFKSTVDRLSMWAAKCKEVAC